MVDAPMDPVVPRVEEDAPMEEEDDGFSDSTYSGDDEADMLTGRRGKQLSNQIQELTEHCSQELGDNSKGVLWKQVPKEKRKSLNLAATRNGIYEYERKTATVEKMKKEAQAKTDEEEKTKMLEKVTRLELSNNALWQKISRRLKKEAKLRSIDKAAVIAKRTAVKDAKKAAKKATKKARRDERNARADAKKAAMEAKKAATEAKKAERAAAKAEKQRRLDLSNDPMSGEYE